jgi:hypothetical protein
MERNKLQWMVASLAVAGACFGLQAAARADSGFLCGASSFSTSWGSTKTRTCGSATVNTQGYTNIENILQVWCSAGCSPNGSAVGTHWGRGEGYTSGGIRLCRGETFANGSTQDTFCMDAVKHKAMVMTRN